MQTKYDKIVERCCRVALLNHSQQKGFIRSIIHAVRHEMPDIELTNCKISKHVHVALGCIQQGNPFIANCWIVADKDESDISELLRMIRNEY